MNINFCKKNEKLYSNQFFYTLYPSFDLNFYINFYDDLKLLNDYEIYEHYHKKGLNENRIISKNYFKNRYKNFNIIIYKFLNNDLFNMNEIQLYKHYHNFGKNENRKYMLEDFYNLYPLFDKNIYLKFKNNKNNDFLDEIKIIEDYLINKKKNINTLSCLSDFYKIYPDFNIKLYKFFKDSFSKRFVNKIIKKAIENILGNIMVNITNNNMFNKNEEEYINLIYNFYNLQNKNNIIYSLKTFYIYFPNFNYEEYKQKIRLSYQQSLSKYTGIIRSSCTLNSNDIYKNELDTILFWLENEYIDKPLNIPKNIIIYPHMDFDLSNGGVTVQYYLAKVLDDYGIKVRIYQKFNNYENSLFNNYYNNDFDLDNTIVIYCEGIEGNPLNAKYVVRWLLSELGNNVKKDIYTTWNKSDLVYYFNSELKFKKKQENINIIYKNLTIIYIYENLKNIKDNKNKNGYCFTLRKSYYHKNFNDANYIHPVDSFEIKRNHTQDDYIEIFNKFEYFISYDPLTFLNIISALCGCISIVYPIENINKKEWLMMTGMEEYFRKTSYEKNLYGIAYGNSIEEIEYSKNTLHLVKKQWDNIIQFYKETHIKSFINDINNFEEMQNTVYNIFNNKN